MAFFAFFLLIMLSCLINPVVIAIAVAGGYFSRAWKHVFLSALFTGATLWFLSWNSQSWVLAMSYFLSGAIWASITFELKRRLSVEVL